jgi:uncharacterized protein YraI
MWTKRILSAGAFLALSAGYAAATPAVVETDLNARTGPGTGYAVIATLPAGSTVEVIGCGGSWCRIDLGGRTAYASRRYLALGGAGPSIAVVPDYDYYEPYYPYDPYYAPGYVFGPSIGIYSRPSWRHRYRGDWRGRRATGQWQGRGQRGQWQGRSSGGVVAAPPSRGSIGAGGNIPRQQSSGSRDGTRAGGAPAAPSGLR